MRISLVGGSTDLESFISTYGRGEVISFPCDWGCYVSVHNNHRNKYIINYSNPESCNSIDEIKNDVAREALRYFSCPPVTLTFNCDIIGTGSGLASSSAYTCAAVAAIGKHMGIDMTEVEVAETSLKLERAFNPLVGRQDPFGCCVSGFKKITFKPNNNQVEALNSDFLQREYDMFLTPAGNFRSSSSILSTIKPESSLPLLDDVSQLQNSIESCEKSNFENVMMNAWRKKKLSSDKIINSEVDKVERELLNLGCKALKLCGAGGGGYFLSFFDKGSSPTSNDLLKISIASDALKIKEL